MNIKDYIHYYIGQRCLNTFFAPGHEMYNVGWILTGFDTESVHPFRLTDIEGERYTWTDSVKPQLRRLSDMTEEDLKKMVNEFALIDLSNCQYEYETVEGKWVNAIENGVVVTSLEVLDGDYVSMMHKDDEMMPMVPQSKAFHYLLKQGFDLFGIIDAGLAIGAKSIQPPQVNK